MKKHLRDVSVFLIIAILASYNVEMNEHIAIIVNTQFGETEQEEQLLAL